MNPLTSQSCRSLVYPQSKVLATSKVRMLMSAIVPYEELSLQAHDQQMEKPRFK